MVISRYLTLIFADKILMKIMLLELPLFCYGIKVPFVLIAASSRLLSADPINF